MKRRSSKAAERSKRIPKTLIGSNEDPENMIVKKYKKPKDQLGSGLGGAGSAQTIIKEPFVYEENFVYSEYYGNQDYYRVYRLA
jgi:hypothetical protein